MRDKEIKIEFIDATNASEILGISKQVFRLWCKQDKFDSAYKRYNTRWFVRKKEVLLYKKNHA